MFMKILKTSRYITLIFHQVQPGDTRSTINEENKVLITIHSFSGTWTPNIRVYYLRNRRAPMTRTNI
ncbi:histone deacetylase 10 isoform X2 [Iris pallida]|uniref:Histone deacetylase 10 isoform X2 n=1 Tax=Iris pallida TaxID=29817 RepID=A0AAX6H8J4_IRIPA|nr:histone deacetylase 10 isoform X2 [Iris pallida]KAJ6837370.1 histone deacetylase 10 isoform X2 [Iris pallida]KAJ6844874.1 histone deacetylase 10 isoform X2 [Iris pallida]